MDGLLKITQDKKRLLQEESRKTSKWSYRSSNLTCGSVEKKFIDKNIKMENKDFQASELGTKEFWENTYKQEFTNFEDNGETGDVWFGKKCQQNIIEWIKTCKEIKHTDAIVDLGTGNGFFLITLAEQGFSCLTGLDYSENAVNFAKAVAKNKNINHITFEVADLLEKDCNAISLQKKYQVCHDKGTFDAISLMPGQFEHFKNAYVAAVGQILVDSGIFIITSCNWTEKQLLEHFKGDFHLKEVIPSPSFQFGGLSGSKYTTLVLIK
ncbi:EEF1A lysine methyltransferase 2 isoform X1 [Octopus sinensis]|uniref:Protein-lysine N-methyltransferase LOC115213154 n=1 Tax=Octopus sinensis TaxID=2607531 RepID=A0A6P7SHT2_9MOLL|nr:EEF1A lysine methyltransferase 2 isoform X1 [Octopus sinensis]XP_036359740.1 EEF1A lysine methyltransferase 2 isoform X1 [Octopus sinensis]